MFSHAAPPAYPPWWDSSTPISATGSKRSVPSALAHGRWLALKGAGLLRRVYIARWGGRIG
jgi:hypothetical protein